MGLLAAAAVFVLSIGILMHQSGNHSQTSSITPSPAPASVTDAHQSQNMPITLAAQADGGEIARR